MFSAGSSGYRMPLAFVFALGLTSVAPALYAGPCTVASVTTYETSGFTCTIEGYTFEDFTFSDSQTGGATLLTTDQITVDPTFSTPDSVSFQFEAPVDGAFSAALGQTEEYIVQYELDPLVPRITGQGIDLGPADPVTLTGQFCGNGMLVGPYVAGSGANCSGTNTSGIFPLNLMNTVDNTLVTGTFPLVVTDVDTRLILDLDGSSSPSSTTYFGTNADITPSVSGVPEPSSLLWLAPAMFAMLWLRKKWSANA